MPTYKYEADDGDIKPIRLAAATKAAAGAEPGGAVTDDDFVKVSKSNREFGMRPRGVRLKINDGTEEEPNYRYRFLPVLSKAAYDGNGFNVRGTVTIDGEAWEIVRKVPEDT